MIYLYNHMANFIAMKNSETKNTHEGVSKNSALQYLIQVGQILEFFFQILEMETADFQRNP